jgi:hypothetical protein
MIQSNTLNKFSIRGADPWNTRPQPACLSVGENFFSQRVVSTWNQIPEEIKELETPHMPSKKDMQNTETGWSNPKWRGEGEGDGEGEDHAGEQKLSERPHWGYGESAYSTSTRKTRFSWILSKFSHFLKTEDICYFLATMVDANSDCCLSWYSYIQTKKTS